MVPPGPAVTPPGPAVTFPPVFSNPPKSTDVVVPLVRVDGTLRSGSPVDTPLNLFSKSTTPG